MDNEIQDFEKWCKESWGKPLRDNKLFFAQNTRQIREYKDFGDMGNSLKMHIAEKLILESCGGVGGYIDSGDISWYIHGFGRSLKGNVEGFGGRIYQPLKAALLLIVHEQFSSALPSDRNDFEHILAGGAALSAMYLMARLENLFRIKSRYLNKAGTAKREIPKQLRKKIGMDMKKNFKDLRCSRINQAFYIFLYHNRTLLAKRLKIMNEKLKIAERLDKIRNPVMHGELEDPGVEARFLGLLIAIFYYGGFSSNKKP